MVEGTYGNTRHLRVSTLARDPCSRGVGTGLGCEKKVLINLEQKKLDFR